MATSPPRLQSLVTQARADRSKGKTGLTRAEREELAKLRKEVREPRMERDRGPLRSAPSVKFAFIDGKRAEFPITVLCRALEVSRGGYYASLGRPLSRRAVEDRRLAILVREAHERSRRTYGSPRVHVELAETHGVFVSRKRVIRIMQQEG